MCFLRSCSQDRTGVQTLLTNRPYASMEEMRFPGKRQGRAGQVQWEQTVQAPAERGRQLGHSSPTRRAKLANRRRWARAAAVIPS